MERSLELYSDDCLYEYEGDQAVKVTETHGQVAAILEALKFSTATTLKVAPPDQQPPDVPTPSRSRRINNEGFKLLTTFEGCELEAYGSDVERFQAALKKAGINVAVDGEFGPVTDKAVKDFQAKKTLTADGTVGPKTIAAIT